MPAKLTCTRCGNTIAADVFDGLCPACMGRAALGSAPVVLDAPRNSTEPREPTLTPEMEAELARLKPEEAGEWIGSYKLMEQLGQGGFGTVWVADQEKPVRRRVALKIIKLGMDTKEVIARFEQERQALAMMDHPNIAKVFDAGATRWGRPYFVMELVRGIKITEYCDQANFPTAERLALFIQVCNAVQHAHQKGIIHRDLKPSNILVTLHDGVPVPKVIDFGVAKATQQQRLSDLTIYTQFEQMIGTPLYMSPEQAEMSGLDIDTRSDIYALGVLLYELLTGRTPIDAETMAQAGMDEIRRLIREVDPPRPSQRLKTLEGNELTTVAKRRHTGPAKLAGSLRGDLDWIVLKCLEKDRKRRYDTANGLALDLQRHLNNEIISARPPTTRYLISKIIKRNRLAFFMGTAIAVSLVVGMAVSTWLAIRASRAEVAANDARLQAEAVILFLTRDLLYKADPEENARGDKKVTMEEVLASAANRLDEDPEIARHPEIEATLRLAVGNTYYRLGAIGEAERYLRRAVELRASRFGPANLETLAAQEDLARFLVLGAQKFEEAEGMAAQTLKSRELLLTANHPDTIESARTYGYVMANVRKLPEAEQLAERVLKANERYYGSNNERTISALGDLAMVRLQRGDIEGYAEASWKEFAAFQRIGKLSSKDSLYSANNAAMSHTFLGEPKLAEAILKAALDRAIQKFGEDGQITSHLQNNLGRTLADLGQFPAAAGYVEKALKTRMSMEAGQESAARSSMLLGRIKLQCHDLVGAEKLLVDAREFFRKRSTAKKELEYQASCWLGMLNWERNKGEEANGLLAFNAEELFAGRNMMTRGEQRVIGECALQFYRANDPQKAEAWQASLKKYLSKQ